MNPPFFKKKKSVHYEKHNKKTSSAYDSSRCVITELNTHTKKGAVSLTRVQSFLDAFSNLPKATISFVNSVSVLPSVRMKQFCCQRTVFQLNFTSEYFPKIYEGVSKIFRTDAVKIIKLTIGSICRHHPRYT
jgi:hypothetical protein